MIDPGLEGRVVLVTGASNPYGIGATTAKAFAAQGARVFAHFFRSPSFSFEGEALEIEGPGEAFYRAQQHKGVDEVLQTVHGLGGRAAAWEADLSDPAAIPELFDRAEAAFGPVEVLVLFLASEQARWVTGQLLYVGGGRVMPL
ncbi:MAG: hypothetical protein KatS3mg115_2443 [Candidatus Poribacteria bacterium]|nr:MAG: hypothetical protein KatS3mg115_2443 [Candidatus Poribacteria bacterium]